MLLTLLAAVVALLWLLQLVLAVRTIRAVPPIPAAVERRTPWPRVSMLVPARDEAAGIEAALRSKLACGYPALELVAVNDRSRDETGAILDRAAASDPRLQVVHVDALPDGWLGKLNAMKRGLDLAAGEWILFSDADVHVEPGAIERLIAHAEAEAIDMIAIFPRMRSVNLVLDSALASLLRVLILSGRAWSANDDDSRFGVGVGAFNLVKKRVLVESGVIDQLRMEVMDDVGLGLVLKSRGARCRLFAGRSDVHLVFLDSIGAAARSVGKGGAALGYSLVLATLFALTPLALDLAIPILAIAAGGIAAGLGAAALATASATHLLLCRYFAAPIIGVLTWPIGHLLNAALTLKAGVSAWRHQGIWWRDTFYSRAVLDAGRRIQVPSLRVLEHEAPAPRLGE